MDIFKLFFNHDLRLDQFAEESEADKESTLEDFMTPTPTFSRFYFAGSTIENEQYGLSTLNHFEEVLGQLDDALSTFTLDTKQDTNLDVRDTIPSLPFDHPLVGMPDKETEQEIDMDQLEKNESGIRDIRGPIKQALQAGAVLVYKEHAPDGYDIQLFSMKNIYESLFHACKPLIKDSFRFFSINSKRINSKRKFYFEAVDLSRPPHGVEEVHADTVL